MIGVCMSQEKKDSLKKFTENTSFHGIQYIGSSKTFTRRSLWIVFVLGGLAGVILQIVDRVQYYYTWPVNVNVVIEYNQSLRFPAVTICNQNAFRASRAAELDWYELIEELFTNETSRKEGILDRYNASRLTVEEIYTTLSHRKEDLFLKCTWKKSPCSPDDFRLILTDHGVCFVFDQSETDMYVSTSGVDSGLQLVLNVEQYEYMPVPHDAAGIKVFLHESKQTPLVYELGQAVPTGSHAFLGIHTTKIDNLPEPFGACEYKRLNHTDFYSKDECYLECFAELARSQCGCRDMYMPSFDQSLPVCALEKYFGCFKELQEMFDLQYMWQCACPIPCQFTQYDTTLSYATISNYIVDKLIPVSKNTDLKHKLLTANEATLKKEKRKRLSLSNLKQAVFTDFEEINEMIRNVSDYIESQMRSLESVRQSTENAYIIKDKLYSYQQYVTEKNFLRAREAMEERTLRTLVNAYLELALNVKRQIIRLANTENQEKRDDLFNLIADTIDVRREINEKARKNITDLIEAFETGHGIFNYSFEDIPREHNNHISPKPLLESCLNRSSLVVYHMGQIRSIVFNDIRDSLDNLKEAAERCRYSNTINETELNSLVTAFVYACRSFMFSKSVVYTEALDYPIRNIELQHRMFKGLISEFDSTHLVLRQNLESIWYLSRNVSSDILPSFDQLFQELEKYFQNSNSSFYNFTGLLLSDNAKDVMRSLDLLFESLHTRKQLIIDSGYLLYDSVFDIWKQIINDENMVEYYRFANMTEFLRSTEEMSSFMNETLSVFTDTSIIEHWSNEEFCKEYVELVSLSESFRDDVKLDSDFVRQNILQLDVFFRHLSYEHIQQQKAYDIFALICDIGGAMGLCIGASMLTIIEIAEFVVLMSSSLVLSKRLKSHNKYNPT